MAESSGENADVANSLVGVAFNIAIFGGGVAGAVLITFDDGLGLPSLMIALALLAFGVAFAARRSAFPPRRSAGRLHAASEGPENIEVQG
jgi:predicted MFS family arabinose efflux permease